MLLRAAILQMKCLNLTFAATVACLVVGCATQSKPNLASGRRMQNVRTTAYTHRVLALSERPAPGRRVLPVAPADGQVNHLGDGKNPDVGEFQPEGREILEALL